MTFKAPDSLAEQIAHHLAERIIRGELAPGERIQEQKVTLALNVSRGSVREAC
jgi:DNA-binding GntR family transcriptional regulator